MAPNINPNPLLIIIFETLLLVCLATASAALAIDEKPPAQIQADTSLYKHQAAEDICIYSGNAKFDQGETHLQSPQITIYKNKDKLNKMIAAGPGSSYNTTNSQQQLSASADSITLDFEKNIMSLEKQGQLNLINNGPNQNSSLLQAPQITVYKIGDEINKIVAFGTGSSYSNNQKLLNANADLITIYPKKETMILEKNGVLVVGKDQYSGPYIDYKYRNSN